MKISVINKSLMHYNGRILPNIFEMVKAYCLAHEKGALSKYLPYIDGVSDYLFEDNYPDLFKWRAALTSDNPPEKVNFRTDFERYRQLVEPIDFSKPYDDELANSIRQQFAVKQSKKVEADADAIAMEELS